MLDQPEILKHHTNPAPETRQAFARHRYRVVAEHFDRPAAGSVRQIQQLQKRCLASTGRTGKEVKAARKQRKAEIGERFRVSAIAQPDIIKFQDALHHICKWHNQSARAK
jgi:hypothetical protein